MRFGISSSLHVVAHWPKTDVLRLSSHPLPPRKVDPLKPKAGRFITMGEFSATCAVSGLPIEEGDDVRIFLLTANPFDEGPCTMDGVWVPRTYPLRAAYDMFGGVTDVEEGPQRDVWLEALKLDVVPKGWGRNTCHDLPVNKTM